MQWREVSHDDTGEKHRARLVIKGCHAIVTDVRVGECHHLSGVGGVSDHFLIATQCRVEDCLTGGDGALEERTSSFAFKDCPVRKNKVCNGANHASSPFITMARPREMVWRTPARRVRPA